MRRKTTRKRKVLIKDHGDGLEFVSVTGGQASAPPSDESPEVKARRLQVALVNAEQNFMKCATERDQLKEQNRIYLRTIDTLTTQFLLERNNPF